MYFLRYSPLKEQLRERTLSEREAFPYLLVYTLLNTFLFESTFLFNDDAESSPLWDRINLLLQFSIAAGGLVYAYRKNGGANGHDFILKYMTLGWVVGIRCILFIIAIIFAYILTSALLDIHPSLLDEGNTPADVVIFALVYLFYMQRLGHHIGTTRTTA